MKQHLKSPPKSLENFVYVADLCSHKATTLASWLAFALVIITTEQVISRYLFNASSIALQELEWHLFGLIFLLGAGYTWQCDEHVRVDILYTNFSPRLKALTNILGFFFLFLPAYVVIVYYGIEFTQQALSFTTSRPDNFYALELSSKGTKIYEILALIEGALRNTVLVGEASADPGGLDARWLIKAAIPLGATILIIQGCANTARSFLFLFGYAVPTAPKVSKDSERL